MFSLKEYDFYLEVTASHNYKALFTKKNAGNFSYSNPSKSAVFAQLNRKSFIESMKFDPFSVLTVKLIHSDRFIERHSPHNVPVYNRFAVLSEADAIITNNKDLIPIITFADCIPIAVIDSKNSVHASIHAGWKGIVTDIVPKTISQMVKNYNSVISDLEIIVGPSIFAKNYEVQLDFIDYLHKNNIFETFKNSLFVKKSGLGSRSESGSGSELYSVLDSELVSDLKLESLSHASISNKLGIQYFFDNRNALKNQLKQCNIDDKQIFWIDIDTYSDKRYSSYRKNNKDFIAQALMVYNS